MKTILAVLIAVLACVPAAFAEDVHSVFERANRAYQQNQPEQAIELYQSLLAEKVDSADLLYNLGNAYYRLGKIGFSILSYEKALRLAPRDAELRANLAFVRSKIKTPLDAESSSEKALGAAFSWTTYLTKGELTAVLLAAFTLVWLFGIAALTSGAPLWSRFSVVFLVISIVLAFGLWFKCRTQDSFNPVVVIEPEAEIMSAFMGNTPLAKVAEGNVLKVRSQQTFKEEGLWLQVQLPRGQMGWIRGPAVREIAKRYE